MPRPADTRVRRARRSDLDHLLDLEARCFRGDRLSARQYRWHLAGERAWLAVAERGGALVGSAMVLFRRDSRAARLYSIAVDPAARGGGIGLAYMLDVKGPGIWWGLALGLAASGTMLLWRFLYLSRRRLVLD